MRIGIKLPLSKLDETPPDVGEIGEWARRVEEAGFSGVWTGDGSFRPRRTQPDPLMVLLSACAATDRVELGSAVYQVPLRHPVELAQRFMTLEALGPGRFSIGVGAGSTAAGHAAVDVSYDDRFKIFGSHMDVIRRLLAGERVGEADIEPWPATRGGPRFLLGAWHSQVWLRRAATQYDGWMCSAMHATMRDLKETLARYRDAGGRRAMIASCTIDLIGPDEALGEDDAFDLRCSPAQAAERLHAVAELGYDDIVLSILDAKQRNSFVGDVTTEQLEAVRALLAPDDRPIAP